MLGLDMTQLQKPAKKEWLLSNNEVTNLKILRKMGYMLGIKIGEGTYSTVCLAIRKRNNNTFTKCACKIINKKDAEVEFTKRFLPRELRILSMLSHPSIVSVYNILEINKVIYVFMDYCENGDLLEYIRHNGPLEENRGRHYFRQIVDAIEYLHNRNLAHRDIKCENIFLTFDFSIKLGDFGFARSCSKENGKQMFSNTFCGSAAYAAPEILKGIPYDPKMYDIWALGCVLYIMITSAMPFDDSNIKKMLRAQLDRVACYHSIWAARLNSPSLLLLLDHLLEPDVKKRAKVQDIINSKWLQEMHFFKCKRVRSSGI